MYKKITRRLYHLYKSGGFVIGLEHFLVMFPSAILIARLTTSPYGVVLELPSILFACGIGTLILTLFKRTPFFLGPSFSYIGFISYQVARISSNEDIDSIRSTILWGYLIAGIIILLLSWLYRYNITKRIIKTIFPPTVMGPAISLIGLELATMAARDSGFSGGKWADKILAIITLVCIILFSLLRYDFLQNASVLMGVIIACGVATVMGKATWPGFHIFSIHMPNHYLSDLCILPSKIVPLLLAVIPCSLIAFIESLGRFSVYEGMLIRDGKKYSDELFNKTISAHSFANIITSITFMMPSAIYAENIAIMNLHSADLTTRSEIDDEDAFVKNCHDPYSIYPYIIASIISIIVALFSGLQKIFVSIPMSILGGMELFVFGLVAAPGIQILVEQQVNYKKISNQIITASVLLAGISNISFTYEALTFQGMSLGLIVGVAVNLLTILLRHFGCLNERFSIIELLEEYVDIHNSNSYFLQVIIDGNEQIGEISQTDFKQYIKEKNMVNLLNKSQSIAISLSGRKRLELYNERGNIQIKVKLSRKLINRMKNDNQKIFLMQTEGNDQYEILLNEFISYNQLTEIIRNIL